MSIIVSKEILSSICVELSQCAKSFLLVSAYCKLPLLKYLDSNISDKLIEKKIIVRFKLEDILSGASDLELYPYCKANGWKIYFRLDLHAKTYVFDKLRCIIGSANATRNGLSLGGKGNYEIATFCELSEQDTKSLENLLLGSVEITDQIYTLMNECVQKAKLNKSPSDEWSDNITTLFDEDFSVLFAEDFPQINNPMEATADELIFLNLDSSSSFEDRKNAFLRSKCLLWLKKILNERNNEIYFGELSARLHSVLLNDPKPYRKEVKNLISNMLSWINILELENFIIDTPNHSQRVRYITR